jgi:hypothetical protein
MRKPRYPSEKITPEKVQELLDELREPKGNPHHARNALFEASHNIACAYLDKHKECEQWADLAEHLKEENAALQAKPCATENVELFGNSEELQGGDVNVEGE